MGGTPQNTWGSRCSTISTTAASWYCANASAFAAVCAASARALAATAAARAAPVTCMARLG